MSRRARPGPPSVPPSPLATRRRQPDDPPKSQPTNKPPQARYRSLASMYRGLKEQKIAALEGLLEEQDECVPPPPLAA